MSSGNAGACHCGEIGVQHQAERQVPGVLAAIQGIADGLLDPLQRKIQRVKDHGIAQQVHRRRRHIDGLDAEGKAAAHPAQQNAARPQRHGQGRLHRRNKGTEFCDDQLDPGADPFQLKISFEPAVEFLCTVVFHHAQPDASADSQRIGKLDRLHSNEKPLRRFKGPDPFTLRKLLEIDRQVLNRPLKGPRFNRNHSSGDNEPDITEVGAVEGAPAEFDSQAGHRHRQPVRQAEGFCIRKVFKNNGEVRQGGK